MSAIVKQETLICKRDPGNVEQLLVLLALDGVTLNIDSGSMMAITTTKLVIDGVNYLPIQSVISIVSTPDGVAITTTVLVVER